MLQEGKESVMRKPGIGFGILISGLVALLLGSCSPASGAPMLKVVTSTSLLACIVERVGGDRVDVINLVPPSQHPGNFDAKPGDIKKLADAGILLLHGWPGEGYADKLVASVNNPDLTVIKIAVDGNWMIPSVQIQATERVADTLAQLDSKNAPAYRKSAEEYKSLISAKEAEIKARLAGVNVSQLSVIASSRQADFLKWAGFNVIATYGAPETLAPSVIKGLVDKGRESGVVLVVDNLQDGADAGKGIAADLGVKQVNLSNFPGGLSDTGTWEKAIDYNIELILKAIQS